MMIVEDERSRRCNWSFFWPTNQSTCFLEIFKVDVNAKHNLGWTPLMVAAMNGHFVAVKTLLDAKANPNIPDSYSQAGETCGNVQN